MGADEGEWVMSQAETKNSVKLIAPTLLAGLLAGVVPQSVAADELTVSAEAMFNMRYFFEPAPYKTQDDIRFDPSAALQPTVNYVFDSGRDSLRGTIFGRFDPTDSGRTHFDVREAFYLHQDDGWDLLIGANQVFWGVAESRHLVNVVNQIDNVEDIDRETFLGQPMVNLSLFGEWGMLDLYAMPYFREREFHEQSARFGLPLSVEDKASYSSDLEEWHPDFAARYRVTWDNWDFGVSHFYGTSRDPIFKVTLDHPFDVAAGPLKDAIEDVTVGGGSLEQAEDIVNDLYGISGAQALGVVDKVVSLRPHYEIINQTGLEAVGVYDDLILKFEGATITGYEGDRIWAVVGGFEYTFTDVDESGIDVGLLGEFLWDNRDVKYAPFTPFNNDAFAGMRVTFNDPEDTNILFGGYVDVDYGSTILNLEASRRIEENMKLSLKARGFVFVDDNDPLRFYDDESYVELSLSVYF